MEKNLKNKLIVLGTSLLLLIILCLVDWVNGINKQEEHSEVQEETTFENVWISECTGNKIQFYYDGFYLEFTGEFDNEIEVGAMADIVFRGDDLINIKLKKDRIYGKILSLDRDYIEVEEYGQVPLDKNYQILGNFGGLRQLEWEDLQIGYEGAEFFVADGNICGIILNNMYVPKAIRVLLKTSNYEHVYHSEAVFSSDTDFIISYGDNEEKIKAGEKIEINANSAYFEDNRIQIKSLADAGEIMVESIERSQGVPSYLGTIEIEKREEGLLLVNELTLEQYLYSVIPSEMPTSYDMEALKAQAVCARSYAYKQMLNNGCAEYGAHVDDSVQYQVYNNISKNAESIQAVDETIGQVVSHSGEVVETYYFSTSYGYTSTDAVWQADQSVQSDYLKSVLLSEEEYNLNMSEEADFREFIADNEFTTYDSEESWYRWETTISLSQIAANINNNVYDRWKVNGANILTMNEDGEFESREIGTIGDLLDITVQERGEGGAICKLLIEGTQATILVMSEYNIRTFLAPQDNDIITHKDERISSPSLLPSAYAYIDPYMEEDALLGFTVKGGGYGHGVGLSQNGAKNMAEAGKEYGEILQFFYSDIEIMNLYEN